ncbi:IS1380 family transposase ISClsp2 [Eubacterium plexicaudatum ASF492]|nr:IS1380 family transposase ISClsp2 [Eubacterium plexicaudatum ASF492]
MANISFFNALQYHILYNKGINLYGSTAMKTIHIEFSDERLITPSGLVFVGQILGKSNFVKKINRAPISNEYLQKQIKNGDILLTYIGMLCQGKPQYEAVREMMDDPDYYKYALGIAYAIPSAETLRQRFDMIGDSLRGDILQANIDMLREMKIEPAALENGYVPVDIDVTPFDNSKTKKEGVSRTYKGFDGYAPIMAYIGTEGYFVNTQLRVGKQHCQKETPDFLRETIELCRQLTDKPLLIRLDSGNDASENIGIFMEESYRYNNVSFIIKRNPRQESKEEWLASVKDCCTNIQKPRDGKTVYIGQTFRDVTYTLPNKTEKTAGIRTIYEITERTIDKHGQYFIVPDIELDTYWTNLPLSDQNIIDLYHAHGESEQYHSEIKTDMDVERLPSGKFDSNKLVLELTIIAYNILRIVGQESLKKRDDPGRKKVRRRRIRTIISNLMQFAGHLTEHAGRLVLSIGRSNRWRFTFKRIYDSFASVS